MKTFYLIGMQLFFCCTGISAAFLSSGDQNQDMLASIINKLDVPTLKKIQEQITKTLSYKRFDTHFVILPNGAEMQTSRITARQWKSIVNEYPQNNDYWEDHLDEPMHGPSYDEFVQKFLTPLNQASNDYRYEIATQEDLASWFEQGAHFSQCMGGADWTRVLLPSDAKQSTNDVKSTPVGCQNNNGYNQRYLLDKISTGCAGSASLYFRLERYRK